MALYNSSTVAPSLFTPSTRPAASLEGIDAFARERRVPPTLDILKLMSPLVSNVLSHTPKLEARSGLLIPVSGPMDEGALTPDKVAQSLYWFFDPDAPENNPANLSAAKVSGLLDHSVLTGYLLHNSIQASLLEPEQILTPAHRENLDSRLPEFYNINEVTAAAAAPGSLLHDIGKVEKLSWGQDGQLTEEEFEDGTQHPEAGAEMMQAFQGVSDDLIDKRLFPWITRFVYMHHATNLFRNGARAYPQLTNEADAENFVYTDFAIGFCDRLTAGLTRKLAIEMGGIDHRAGETFARSFENKSLLQSLNTILREFKRDSIQEITAEPLFPSLFYRKYRAALIIFIRSLHSMQQQIGALEANGRQLALNNSLMDFLKFYDVGDTSIPIVEDGLLDKMLITDLGSVLAGFKRSPKLSLTD